VLVMLCLIVCGVNQECDSVDEDSRADLVWWKCKKWSLHILTRCFQRSELSLCLTSCDHLLEYRGCLFPPRSFPHTDTSVSRIAHFC